MTETRLRGTDKGEVVTEALVEGVWVDTAAPIAVVVTEVDAAGEAYDEMVASEPPPKRRGRPPKAPE
jgi:hypothetical protein